MKLINDLGIVISAGGSSSRFGTDNKLLREICAEPVFIRSLKNSLDVSLAHNIVLAVHPEQKHLFEEAVAKYLPGISGVNIVEGGRHRMDSVFRGLSALSGNISYVAVHDAARPLASRQLFMDCLDAAIEYGGGVAAAALTDTVKEAGEDGLVVSNPDRSRLWTVQTPQIFPLEKLISAYEKAFADKIEFTDDSGVMEYSGFPVKLVENKNPNIKITFPKDLPLAEFFLQARTSSGL